MAIQKYSTKFHPKKILINLIMAFVFKKIKTLTFFFFLFQNFNLSSNAHLKGTFSTEKQAEKKSVELGCIGIHKNQDKWLPCENEKELHKYLRN